MENEFIKVMSESTDEELTRIVTVEREKYNPIAIEAANVEIEKRNIDTSEFEKIREKTTAEKEQKKKVESILVPFEKRVLNCIVDSLLIVIITFVIMILPDSYLSLSEGRNLFILLYFSIYFSYYIFMEVKYQKTLGKFLTKTKVINLKNEKPETNEIILRTLCRFVPFDGISFLFMKNGFHDILSKTKVIKDNVK